VRERCTARGIPLIHDIDDLIFDPAAMRFGQIAFIDQLPQQKRQRWLADALGFRHRSPWPWPTCSPGATTTQPSARRWVKLPGSTRIYNSILAGITHQPH
jgi:hypothetical protein